MNLPLRNSLVAGFAVLVAMVTLVATAHPAHAIRRIGCEADYWNFFRIYTDAGETLCFADAGEMNVAIYGVNSIGTGNNVVRFRYREGINSAPIEVGIGKYSGWQSDWVTVRPYVHKFEWIKIH